MEARRSFRGFCYNPDQKVDSFKFGGGNRHDVMRNVGFRIYSSGLLMVLLKISEKEESRITPKFRA